MSAAHAPGTRALIEQGEPERVPARLGQIEPKPGQNASAGVEVLGLVGVLNRVLNIENPAFQ